MTKSIDGKALVYADSAFNTPNGKTAHGLVRFTERYEIVGVLDHRYAGQDAGMVLDNKFYNSIKFQTHSISIGYSFSIVPHLLYIDLGTVYSSTNYILGRYNSNLGADSESEPINADAIMLETSVNLYLTHYLFLNWLHQQSLDDTYVISYVNNLGISFLARF